MFQTHTLSLSLSLSLTDGRFLGIFEDAPERLQQGSLSALLRQAGRIHDDRFCHQEGKRSVTSALKTLTSCTQDIAVAFSRLLKALTNFQTTAVMCFNRFLCRSSA